MVTHISHSFGYTDTFEQILQFCIPLVSAHLLFVLYLVPSVVETQVALWDNDNIVCCHMGMYLGRILLVQEYNALRHRTGNRIFCIRLDGICFKQPICLYEICRSCCVCCNKHITVYGYTCTYGKHLACTDILSASIGIVATPSFQVVKNNRREFPGNIFVKYVHHKHLMCALTQQLDYRCIYIYCICLFIAIYF